MRAALLAVAAVAIASTFAAAATTRERDVAELTRLSDAWDKAIVHKDEKAVADNMAEDFRQIDGYGNLETKKSFVAGIIDSRLSIDPYTVEEFEVRLYGDTALLSGRTHMTGRYDGKAFQSNYRYIDIYVRRDGAWKIVSVQITRIPPAAVTPPAAWRVPRPRPPARRPPSPRGSSSASRPGPRPAAGGTAASRCESRRLPCAAHCRNRRSS